MKVTLFAPLIGSITTAILIILVFYLAEIGVSAPSPSYATHSLGHEIQELATFPISNPSSSNGNNNSSSSSSAISANTMMAILPNSSTVVYETEAFVVPSTVKTFVIYMANEFHENWPEESHKLITKQKCLCHSYKLDSIKWNRYSISYG
jgi:hypothetical protein